MISGIERVETKLTRLTETTDRRLENLEAAVGQLNQLVADMRTPIGVLNPNRGNGSNLVAKAIGAWSCNAGEPSTVKAGRALAWTNATLSGP